MKSQILSSTIQNKASNLFLSARTHMILLELSLYCTIIKDIQFLILRIRWSVRTRHNLYLNTPLALYLL